MTTFLDDKQRRLFFQHLQPYAHCDVFIDRFSDNTLFRDIPELEDDSLEKLALLDLMFGDKPDQSPLIVRIPSEAQDLLERLLDHATEDVVTNAQKRTVCGFLLGTKNLMNLRTHLSEYLNAKVENLGQIFFRYFDPRVLQQLPHILTQHQLHRLFEPLDTWISFNWHGTLHLLQRPEPDPQQVGYSLLDLSSAQWPRLQRVEPINLTLWKLKQKHIHLPQAQDLDQLIVEAEQKLPNLDDQVNYAVYAYLYEQAFTRHPALSDVIAKTIRTEIPFQALAEQLLLPSIDPDVLETNEEEPS
jgi:hypothetical protein